MGNEFSGAVEVVDFNQEKEHSVKSSSRSSKKAGKGKDERLDKYYEQMKGPGKKNSVNNNDKKQVDKPVEVKEKKQSKGLDMIDMAGMMAYVKDVAKHSGDLPLTRRDDPELGRTVSSLTSREYAIKAAAFIPPDVRILAGASLDDNGHNWDLPKAKEFNIKKKAREPGASQGACSNSLLKVLYDNEHEQATDLVQHEFAAQDNLFGDEDESINEFNEGDESIGSIDFEGLVASNSLSWDEILRKMHSEMAMGGYKQAPILCTSRKFDLSEEFSLVPEGFDAIRNKKYSILIGCNYADSYGEITGAHDDVRSVKDFLVNVHGFDESKDIMKILLDDDDEYISPTYSNILNTFHDVAAKCKEGDAVFVQFSGHGGRVLDSGADTEADCYDEVLIPSDFLKRKKVIRDTDIFKCLLAQIPEGVRVTMFLDACDSGVTCDLPFSWSTKNDHAEALAKLSLNDDFSFVRFLKVVKSVYEGTTGLKGDDEEESDEDSVESLMTMGGEDEDTDEESEDEKKVTKTSLLETLGGCFTAPTSLTQKRETREEDVLSEDESEKFVAKNKKGGYKDKMSNAMGYKDEEDDNRDEDHRHISNYYDSGSREESFDSFSDESSYSSESSSDDSDSMPPPRRRSNGRSSNRRGGRRY